MSHTEPKNTLQQDLLLLAKSHYKTELSLTDSARLVCAFHILMPSELMRVKDTNYWILKEFVTPGIILNNMEKLTRFFLELGGHFNWLTLEGATSQMEYQHNLLHGLMSEISTTQVYREGVLLLPFEVPSIDPSIVDLLKPKVVVED